MKSQRSRARLTPVDLASHFSTLSGYERDAPPVNRQAHRQLHEPKKLLYTSVPTLSTTAGSPFYPPFSARIVKVAFGVATTGSSDTTLDLLLNGTSIFVGATLPSVIAGTNWGYAQVPTLSRWSADNQDYIQFQLTATGSAGGPLVATIYFYEALGGKI